jgi:hypothetical protein
VPAVGAFDLARTHVTLSNIGAAAAFSVSVDTIRCDSNTIDFETINELEAGASFTCLAIVYPVVGNDPHWSFEFWTGSGEDFALPFTVRYNDKTGQAMVTRSILNWDGHRLHLSPDNPEAELVPVY